MATWDLDSILDKAREQEEKYGWLYAAWSYEHVLRSIPEEKFSIAEITQHIGYCYKMAARQSENKKEFEKLQSLAAKAYEEASKHIKKIENKENKGKSEYYEALANFLQYRLESTFENKTKTLEACYSTAKKAVEIFHKNDQKGNVGLAYNLILKCIWEQLRIAPTENNKHALSQEALDYSVKSISVLTETGDTNEVLEAYYLSSLHHWYAANISDREEACNTLAKISLEYAEAAQSISKELKSHYSKANSLFAATLTNLFFTDKLKITLEYAQEMLEQGTAVGDNVLKGIASYLLALATDDLVPIESNPDKKKEYCEKIIEIAQKGIVCLQKVNRDEYLSDIYMLYTQNYSTLSKEFAANPIEKLEYSKKAIEIGRKGLEHAKNSHSPEAMGESYHVLSKALQYDSLLGYTNSQKRKILQEALEFRNEYIKIIETTFPSNYWILGLGKIYAAQIRTELAEIVSEENEQISLLKEAASSLEEGLIYCEKWISHRPETTLIATTAIFKSFYGKLLENINQLLHDETYLRKANSVLEDTATKFEKIDSPNRVAETYWRIARNQDVLRDRKASSKNFLKASQKYEETAQQIPVFSDFFFDYSLYMKAWSEIEKAKDAHDLRQNALAMKHYLKTAEILEQSKGWEFLASNYKAWAALESAEFQSRKEKSDEALESFKQANKLFLESKNSLQIYLSRRENREESQVINRLIVVSEIRGAYCFGRIAIEEARIFEKQGNSIAGAKKYGFAAETFENIVKNGSEQIEKELQPIIYLCKAWQKMRIAETKSSSQIYGEAAELFKKACEYAIDQSMGLLALAHSNFCKALEAGTDFESSRDLNKYAEAKKYLEIAESNYLKTGYKKAAEYANGTQRLFDAYVYIEKAKTELDPEKKTKYYSIAEKVLQYSALSFSNAQLPEKKLQVDQLLQKINEEKELALMLTEILTAPTIISSTENLVAPTPTEENAVGLESFEGANIQANISQIQQAKSNEDFSLEINIVNIGKESIQISRILNIIPQGFTIIEKPEFIQIEGTSINAKNKLLTPMVTEKLNLVLRSPKHGLFEVNPEIVYIQENGNQLSYHPNPTKIEISEISELNRISTGYYELDKLLVGGIPEKYPIILTAPFCEERNLLIKRFLKQGLDNNETIFYFTDRQNEFVQLAQDPKSKAKVFIFNPFKDQTMQESPNIFRLKDVEKLTDISIAVTTALRKLNESNNYKRVCIEILSDVLLQHNAVTTRRWLNGIINDLRNQGFTTLAVMNPLMHSPQDVQAILGLFDGEITLEDRKTSRGSQKILKIDRLYNQKYLPTEITVDKENLVLSLAKTKEITKYINTGSADLDKLLIDGIPQTFPVILKAPFCDERDQLIKQFINTGLTEEDTVFYICTEINDLIPQISKFQSKFYVFICNPQADMFVQDSPNVFKLKKGVMNLTDINIAITKAFRSIQDSTNNQRRICINLVSDLLLQHNAVTTKKWLTGLIAELKSKGFTTLAVMNPLMHSPQDVQAILGLFDGEITLEDRKTSRGSQKILKIDRLYNQKYLPTEITITNKK